MGSPSSCLVKIGKTRLRSLVDTGAEVSLVQKRVLDSLQQRPRISKEHIDLQTVSGNSLGVIGSTMLNFSLGKTKLTHKFFVVTEMNRSMILGRDWLTSEGVRLYYDLGCLRVGDTYVPFENDAHISSLVRLTKKVVLRPQTTTLCNGRAKCKGPTRDSLVELAAVERGYVASEPGLHVVDAVATVGGRNRLPLMLVNSTNKTFTLRRGTVIAKSTTWVPAGKSINAVNHSYPRTNSHPRLPNSQNQVNSPSLNYDEVNCPPAFKRRLWDFLQQNDDVFAQTDEDLTQTSTVEMKIDTGDCPPIKMRPYRTPLNKRKFVDTAVDDMLSANIIRPSSSAWSFPIVIVDKKDGTKRFCVDFRRLNQVTRPMSFPLPVIDDILSLLGNATYFTALDCKSGYWQCRVAEEDKAKTAFACHRGLFEFNVMCFGLANAPGVFQQLMTKVLTGLGHFAIAYIDDILIFSSTLSEHLSHIQTVFNRLRQHNLKLKLKKCQFMKEETNYLGFIINQHGIKPDLEKVRAIRSLPPPTSVREVRSFIGLCNYYRRFIPNFSKIAEPVVTLTKKYAKFKWDESCDQAFQFLKAQLTAVPLLTYPDPSKPYTLYTDASDT